MPVIPLHLHSHWSLLDGVASVPEIVLFAQSANLPAIALIDSNALHGAMEFVAVCRKVGIAPILGAELNWVGGHTIVLFAQNMRGYGNLCRLITRLQSAPERQAALVHGLSLNDLAPHTDGLIARPVVGTDRLMRTFAKITWGTPNPSRTNSSASSVVTDLSSN